MSGTVRADRKNFSGYAAYSFVAMDAAGVVVGVSEAIYGTPGLAIQEGEKFLADYNRAAKIRRPVEPTSPEVA